MSNRRLAILEELAVALRDGKPPPNFKGVDLTALLRGFRSDHTIESGWSYWFDGLTTPTTRAEVAHLVADRLDIDLDRPALATNSSTGGENRP